MFFDIFKKFKRQSLEDHQFFSTMNYWINIEIDNIPVQNPLKKNVIRTFLKIKFSVFEKNFKNYIKNYESFDNLNSLENVLVSSLKECDDEAIKKGIPSIFLDKFKKWDDTHTDITFESIKFICNSKFYHSPYERAAAVLDILLFSFRLTIVDAERTISELNGELEETLKGTIFDL